MESEEEKTLGGEISRVVNRHMARLYTDLDVANCPNAHKTIVKSELAWLRTDLQDVVRDWEAGA